MNIIQELTRSKTPKVSTVKVDEFTQIAQDCFDFEFKGQNEFYPFEVPSKLPKDFNIGVICGCGL